MSWHLFQRTAFRRWVGRTLYAFRGAYIMAYTTYYRIFGKELLLVPCGELLGVSPAWCLPRSPHSPSQTDDLNWLKFAKPAEP